MRRRHPLWLGLGLVVIAILGALAGLYLSGVIGRPAPEKPALCYVSPTDPNYIRFQPGKDDKGQELVPVYVSKPSPQAAGGAPALARKVKYWVSPMDPKYRSDKPGKDPMGMDLVPVYEAAPPAAPPPTVAAPPERKIKYWISPMDPGYVSDKPGKAPCGMDLVPVYETVGEAPGTIAVSPTTVQSMGVRTAKVEVRPLSRVTLAVGLVTFDERSLSQINTKINGWVDRLYVNATGDPVRRGQTLLSIYSPELVSAQEEYLLALKNQKVLEKSPFPDFREGARRLVAASRQRLAYWDITAGQIADLERTGRVKKHLALTSPANGIVTKRLVTQGQYVQAGMPLLEVADLSTIWVDAEIYQYELPWIEVGQPVIMTLQYLPGESFRGRIDYIYPYLQGTTRTVKVRLRFPNPGLKLKPEMFAQVKIESPVVHEAVVVPSEAVLNTGLKQHVFIALGGGRFEPREVKLGVEGEGGVREVLSGLKGGEDVVISAQFMLDSESRFREAVQMMMPGMPGMQMEEKAAPPTPAMPVMKMEEKGAAPAPAAPVAPAPAPMPPGHRH
jgi:Cu(I)/Ag(I) efflux system membrane fusion protein/cobalt-zinc-cadmium efflux system membrane fusion protein